MATFPFGAEDGPDPGPGVQAAIAAGIEQAYQAVAASQAEAHTFFVTHGGNALPGHRVGKPGRMGDPDAGLPDAADS